MYKIETHLHTTYISHCGWLGAQAIMKAYSAAGYDDLGMIDYGGYEIFAYRTVFFDCVIILHR